MAQVTDFVMERWQSIYENQVDFNLSESGVHPVTLRQLMEIGAADLLDTPLGYGQSNGTELLRSRIAALYPGAQIDNVVVANGSAEANFVALWHLVEPGDEVVILLPTYMQSAALVNSLGGVVREVWLREELGWQPELDQLRRAITDHTKAIVVTNPNNPTGAVLHDNVRAEIMRAAERVGAYVLADEVYTGAEIDGAETPSLWQSDARVIATGSLSKAYGLPGLRIGWAVAPRAVADRLWSRKDYTTISPGELTDRCAALALTPEVRAQLLQRTRTLIQHGLAIVERWLHAQQVFSWRAPDAGAILFARYLIDANSSMLAERLRAEQSVLIVPGDHFGLDRYFRFGFGIEPAVLEGALARFSALLQRLT
jgi:aspartate/methionine/tyrosine aminotransferase